MNKHITILTYHFIRDLAISRYPAIKGLTIDGFKGQLDYISKYYTVMKMTDLIEAISSTESTLPSNALLLTFDDGYLDHFTNVFPILVSRRLTGCFFPPAKAIAEHKVLDVNKIHFVLASVGDKSIIIQDIFTQLDEFRNRFNLMTSNIYYHKLAMPNRFDTAEVIFIKRLLQRELPEEPRKIIVDRLFRRFVTDDEASFARELYMTTDQLTCMRECGMAIGSHGYDHYWLDTLDRPGQEREIDLSLDFLKRLGCGTADWVISYPYGAYNEGLLTLLRRKGCILGFTTKVAIADLGTEDPLALSRLDTNDLPKTSTAAVNEWTLRVQTDAEQR